LALLGATAAVAQTRLDGTIEGQVLDAQGLVVPGATVTVSSPALIQATVVTTSPEGRYRAIQLPVGTYTIRFEMVGFKTQELTGIELSVGRVLVMNAKLDPGTAETVTVVAETPVIDTQQVKNVQTITQEVIDQLPLARNLITGPSQLAPGVVERTSSGSRRNETNYLIDGANVQAPDQGYSEAAISWDAIEEIEFITTTNPMENYAAIGGTLNLVTRTGGNNFHGMGSIYFTNKDLSQILLPKEHSDTLKIGQPSLPEYEREISARVAGPVVKDRLWFVANYRKSEDEKAGTFVPVTIRGVQYDNYNAPLTQSWAFVKLTAQVTPTVRWFGSWNYADGDAPQDLTAPPARRTLEATRHHQQKQHTASSQLTWTISKATLLDARFGLWRFKFDGTSQDGTEQNFAFSDAFSGYQYGRWSVGRSATDKRNYNGSVTVTHFVDGWGGTHEFKGGLDYQHMNGAFFFSSLNSVGEWRTYKDNLYYYRGLLGLSGPDPVRGDGLLTFLTASTEELGSGVPNIFDRVGGFVSDVWRVNSRLTLNLGLRYDYTTSKIEDLSKPPADPLAQAIGEAVFVPRWGINPFGQLSSAGQDDRIPWKGFSAQMGVAYDLTGDGKTIVKATAAKYQERLLGWHIGYGVPTGQASFPINWWDLNGNQQPDPPGVDRYAQANNASPLAMQSTTWHENIDPNLKTPYMREFRLGIERELGSFNVGIAGVYRDRKNQISALLYDLNTGTYWSDVDSGYWVPFQTTVPAAGSSFPAVPVTVYFQKTNAPAAFNRVTNVPQAEAKYQALELTANKRWNKKYMLGASVVFSKNYGNYEVSGADNGLNQFQTPNYEVNRENSREPFDRPVVVKLWGSVLLPADIRASYNFIYTQGAPWNRTVTVQPPAAWAAANGASTASQSVWLEPRGDRRDQSTTNLDLRVEKLFRFASRHEIGLFVDAFNATGFSYVTYQSNPGGTWAPTDINTTTGTYSPASTSALSQVGVRTFRFGIRYMFN
jgi:outer membrane receptor protein involved in Fe transport